MKMVTNWAIVIYEWFCVGFCRFSPVAPRERLGLGGRTHARHDFSRCVCETVDSKNLSTLAHTCRDRRLLLGICLFSLTWTCVLSLFLRVVCQESQSFFFFFFLCVRKRMCASPFCLQSVNMLLIPHLLWKVWHSRIMRPRLPLGHHSTRARTQLIKHNTTPDLTRSFLPSAVSWLSLVFDQVEVSL